MTIVSRFRSWRARRASTRARDRLDRLLASRHVRLGRYTDDSLAWLEIDGFRLYFDGPEERKTVTTYQPEERKRTLILTNYRQP